MRIVRLARKTLDYQRRWGWRHTFSRILVELRRRAGTLAEGYDESLGLCDLSKIPPTPRKFPGRIVVHVHADFPSALPEIAVALGFFPYRYELLVSVPDASAQAYAREILSPLPGVSRLVVRPQVSARESFSASPLLSLCADYAKEAMASDFLLLLRTRCPAHFGKPADNWLGWYLHGLVGDATRTRRIFSLFLTDPRVGLVYPQNPVDFPHWANTWPCGRNTARTIAARYGFSLPNGEYLDFPASGMLWARTRALRPLLQSCRPGGAADDGDAIDEYLLRLLLPAALHAGYSARILSDDANASWSRWRFDLALARSPETELAAIMASGVELVAFDIFDTLLVRPLLDPDATKSIVALRLMRHMGKQVAASYDANRNEFELRARDRLAREVSLTDIEDEFVYRGCFDRQTARAVRELEETVERASVRPRPDMLRLFNGLVGRGLRVVLASDMFLSRETIEAMLADHGITGYGALYLSNQCNARKDSGALFEHILATETVSPDRMLMIGDNERSDVRIPLAMGIASRHVLRPVDQALALPRWRALLEGSADADCHDRLTLGLVVREFFGVALHGESAPRGEDFTHGGTQGIGYAIVGPMLMAFTQWLRGRVREDRIGRLLFLSREGRLLKAAWDRCAAAENLEVESDYLVLSRRTVTVASLRTREDVYALASGVYFPNTLRNFLHYRFGLDIDAETLAELDRNGVWPLEKKVELSGQASHLYPLLDALMARILERAAWERQGLQAYLAGMRLPEQAGAIVDVGYSATIQDHLSRFIAMPLPGYYMMTSKKAASVRKRHNTRIAGCYGEDLVEGQGDLSLWLHAFEVEQLLSADDAQIAHYAIDEANPGYAPRAVYQELSAAECSVVEVRAALQQGALRFIDDALTIGRDLMPGFSVSPRIAERLFRQFVAHPSSAELASLRRFLLDDHYCGRGVVAPLRGGDYLDGAN